MIKKIILLITVICVFNSCTQSTKSVDNLNQNIFMSANPKLTSENYIATMLDKVKQYPDEPYYYLFVSNKACYYEILVNDLPVYKYYKEGQTITPIDINYAINKSGKQTITYKLYPLSQVENGKGFDKLLDFTSINIHVFKRNQAVKSDPFSTEEKIIENKSLNKPNSNTFIAEGQKHYEYTFTFEADVPYENKGWNNSVDLSKMDQKELLQKTETAYKTIWKIIDERKTEDFFGYLYAKEIETCQSEYSKKENLQESLEAYLKPFKVSTFKMQPLENYKMALYGNGKLVCLEQTSSDLRLRGKSSLWGKFKDEDENTVGSYRKLYLHIPSGQTAFEIIR